MPRINCALAALVLSFLAVPRLFGGEALTEPLIAKVHRGELAPVEQTLRRKLVEQPVDDNARFALALVQVARAFERGAQFHYEYGAKFGNAPFLLPSNFKENPHPNRINYLTWRRELETMHHDIEAIEKLLAEIRDPQVKVTIPLGKLKWDLNGDGEPENWLPDNATTFSPHFKKIASENPTFTVAFDYADVLWFRGYCHLTMAALDFILALDLQELFDGGGEYLYTNPRLSKWGESQTDGERGTAFLKAIRAMQLAEPDRWRLARSHLIRVTELSLETWDAVERETDADFEWLPNPNQQAAIRIKTTPEMITAWRNAMREGQAVLEGRKLYRFPSYFYRDKNHAEQGLNVKRFLDDPPETFPIFIWQFFGRDNKYVEKGNLHDEAVFNRLDEVFDGQSIEFSFWFN